MLDNKNLMVRLAACQLLVQAAKYSKKTLLSANFLDQYMENICNKMLNDDPKIANQVCLFIEELSIKCQQNTSDDIIDTSTENITEILITAAFRTDAGISEIGLCGSAFHALLSLITNRYTIGSIQNKIPQFVYLLSDVQKRITNEQDREFAYNGCFVALTFCLGSFAKWNVQHTPGSTEEILSRVIQLFKAEKKVIVEGIYLIMTLVRLGGIQAASLNELWHTLFFEI